MSYQIRHITLPAEIENFQTEHIEKFRKYIENQKKGIKLCSHSFELDAPGKRNPLDEYWGFSTTYRLQQEDITLTLTSREKILAKGNGSYEWETISAQFEAGCSSKETLDSFVEASLEFLKK